MYYILSSLKAYLELESKSGVKELLLNKRSKDLQLDLLKRITFLCKKCPLHRKRKNVVFGTGDADSKLMFIGEAPGLEEDLRGEPFVGEAGALLTKIIEAMSLNRERVYICNIVKCRPPNNREPSPEEVNMCKAYCLEQIRLIMPKVICTLGKVASQTILDTSSPITKLRGNLYDFFGRKVMPTFHPAYLLRNPKDKILVWQDMQKIMEIL